VPTVIEDIVKGHRIVEDSVGLHVTRVYHVEGLDKTSSALVQAYSVTGLPKYGDPDQDFTGIVCQTVTFMPAIQGESREQVTVTAQFDPPDFSNAIVPVVRFAAAAREVTSEFYPYSEAGGAFKPLKIKYIPTGGPADTEPYVAQRRDAKRIGILEIDRIETQAPTTAIAYIGTLNSGVWQGQPKFTWYCRTVAFEKELYRSGYRVHYEFEYDPEYHIDTLAYRRNFDGRVPADIAQPVDKFVAEAPGPTHGWINVARGRQLDFNGLNLPAVFA
jgi:hypothetical protein